MLSEGFRAVPIFLSLVFGALAGTPFSFSSTPSTAPNVGACFQILETTPGSVEPVDSGFFSEEGHQEILEHIFYGRMEEGREMPRLMSGLHAYEALSALLSSRRMGLDSVDWIDFDHLKSGKGELKLPGQLVKMEQLPNGVMRAQLGEDFWLSQDFLERAKVSLGSGTTLVGIKSLFPSQMTRYQIQVLIEDFFSHVKDHSSELDLKRESHSFEDCFRSSHLNLPEMRLRMTLNQGIPVSFFPTWDQFCH